MKGLSKKILSVILGASLLVSLFTGCTKNKDLKVENKGPVTLELWSPSPGSIETALVEQLNAFNKQYEGKIQAKWTFIPRGGDFGYENKITASVASKTMPDVLKADGPNISNYAYMNILQPIGSYFTKDELSDFLDSIIKQGTYEGKLYALGETESSVAVYYNKKLLDKAGIKAPTKLEDAWTWDQFYEATKKLTTNGVYGLNLSLHMGVGEWLTYMGSPFLWSNNAKLISDDGTKTQGVLNSSEAVEALQYIQKMAKEKIINLTPTPTEFEEGKAAMRINGTWQSNTMKKYPDMEWGITYLPYSKKKVSPSGDWAWGISTQGKHPKEAAELIKWLTRKESVVNLANAGGKLPSRKSAFDELKNWDKAPQNVLKDQALNTASSRPRVKAYPVLTQQFSKTFDDILKGADVKQALDNATKKIDEDIQRNYK